MKAFIILGSRNPKGQTASAAEALIEGLKSGTVQAEKVFLPQKSIGRCRQCNDDGWGICLGEGRCMIDDDFPFLVDKIRQSDIVVFATPVYFADLSESMKAFLDRLRRTTMHDKGKQGIARKAALGICVAGGGGGGAPACSFNLQKILNTCGFNVVDMVEIRRQNLDMKLKILKSTGQWLAKT
ncbi:MAG TPA: flavodoxin family protein [bacterium]|jgi:multimeric flavodoxin WrbA|nr:flavodoxin family protein [bacterium]